MRAFILTAAVATFLAACDPPMPPIAPDPPRSENGVLAVERPHDETPHVVRRLVAEAQAQMAKNQEMVTELTDIHGRLRAQGEIDRIGLELGVLAARIDDPASSNLDDVMQRLSALNARIDDLHDALRVATERTAAVSND